jgi:hypothetical protein
VGALIELRNSDAEGLGAKTDYKTEHGQAAIPGLGERDETETVIRAISVSFCNGKRSRM